MGYVVALRDIRILPSRRKPDSVLLKTIGIPFLVTATFAVLFVLANTVMRQVADDLWEYVVRFVNDQVVPFVERFSPSEERALFWAGCLWLAAALLRPKELEITGRPVSPRAESRCDAGR